MKFKSKCFPPGALPYRSVESATKLVAKFFDQMPFLAELPNMCVTDTVLNRTLSNIPGVLIKDSKIELKPEGTVYQKELAKLNKAFNNPNMSNLDYFRIEAPFMEKFLQIVKKFKSANAVVNLLGPFTMSQLLNVAADEQMLTERGFRRLYIQAVCVKALWIINKIKEYCPTTVPIIVLDEFLYGQLGNLKRENEDITVDMVTNIFAKVTDKIKSAGALVAVQCFDKCDWKIPINAGVDIISFDAYNNPNNLCIIPQKVIEFVSHGGKINWGIVPVMTESMITALNIDYVSHRLHSTLEGLILSGVPEKYVYDSALVSIQGNVCDMPVIFAEKSIILSTQLSKRIMLKSKV